MHEWIAIKNCRQTMKIIFLSQVLVDRNLMQRLSDLSSVSLQYSGNALLLDCQFKLNYSHHISKRDKPFKISIVDFNIYTGTILNEVLVLRLIAPKSILISQMSELH